MTIRHIVKAVGLGAGMLLCSVAFANVNNVTGSAQPISLSPSSVGAVNLRWQLFVSDASTAPRIPQSVTSVRGQVLAPDGRVLQTLPATLSQTGFGNLNFTESVPVSPTTVRSWLIAGYQRVVIQRTFTPLEGRSATGRITLALTDSQLNGGQSQLLDPRTPTASLVLRNLELRFQESLAAMEVVEPNTRLRAELRIHHSGNGIFEGEWQVAEPGSTEGLAIYRPLSRVRQALTGQQLSVLLSPQLPTRVAGKYLLRFCAVDPAAVTASERANLCVTPQTTVETVYQVLSTGETALESMQVLAPKTAAVTRASRFEWAPVRGSVVYQLQVFSLGQDAAPPAFVTGMLLPNDQVATLLSPLMIQHMKTGGRYLWRINALDETGRVIGRSDENRFTYSTE